MSDAAVKAAAEIAEALAGAGAARPVTLLSFGEMLAPNLATKGLVKGIIDREALALVYGEPGSGKTFLGLDLALSVAAGRGWFGRSTKRGRVIYVAAEAGKSIRNRVAAWAGQRWDERTEVDFHAVVSPVDLCHLKDGENLKRLRQLVETIGKADIVIIDTVSRALAGGDENSPADMGAFVNALDRLRARLGCAIVAIHHVGKDASRGARGHSLLRCAVDTEIAVERRGEGVSVATVTKQRDGVAGIEIAFRLRSVTLGQDQDGDPVTSCVVEAAEYVPPPRATRLSANLTAALDVLKAVVADKGEAVPYRDLEVLGVKVEAWREAMAANGQFGNEKTGQFRAAWKRARDGLAAGGHVEFGEGYVWPCGAARADDVPF
jgi:KaiC/GvpD/RAD55 family RecA-like ATPase